MIPFKWYTVVVSQFNNHWVPKCNLDKKISISFGQQPEQDCYPGQQFLVIALQDRNQLKPSGSLVTSLNDLPGTG